MSGALLPDDYTKHTSIPDRPFICPIRSCRHLHKNVSDLSIHWEVISLSTLVSLKLWPSLTLRTSEHTSAVILMIISTAPLP